MTTLHPWRTLVAWALVAVGFAAATAGLAMAHVGPFASARAAAAHVQADPSNQPQTSPLRADDLFKPAPGTPSPADDSSASADTPGGTAAEPEQPAVTAPAGTSADEHPSGGSPGASASPTPAHEQEHETEGPEAGDGPGALGTPSPESSTSPDN